MPINWSAVFDTIIDITAAVGEAAMKIAVIDNAVNRCRSLSSDDMVLGFSREVSQMDSQVWDFWRIRLTQLANAGDQTASFMLQIGDFTRQELNRIIQLTEFHIDEAISISIQRMQDQPRYEQMCFFMALVTYGETNLKADVISKRLLRLLQSG